MTKRKGTFPKIINGIAYQSQEELDEHIHADAEAMAHIIFDMYKIHKQFESRLEREPQGFIFPSDGRICKICMGGGSGDFWYDKRGMRCIDCQTAYINKNIPAYVFTDDKNRRHITETSLIVRHNARRQEIRKYIKEGVLKARYINHGEVSPTLLFLKSENPDLTLWSNQTEST